MRFKYLGPFKRIQTHQSASKHVQTTPQVKKTDVPVSAAGVPGMPAAEVQRMTEAEGEMQAADKLQEDTQVGGGAKSTP